MKINFFLTTLKIKSQVIKEEDVSLKNIGFTTFFITLINVILLAIVFFILNHANPYGMAPQEAFLNIHIPLQLALNFLLMGLFLFISLTLFLLRQKLSDHERSIAHAYRDWGLGFCGFFLCAVAFVLVPIIIKTAWTL